MQRRKFLKTGCTLCVGSVAGVSALSLLQSCAPGNIINTKIMDDVIKAKTSDFPKGKSYIILRNNQLIFDILLHKNSDKSYKAIYMQCSHNDNPVYAISNEIFCPAHGSKFDLNGNVKLEPATVPLKSFRTELKENIITIYLK